VTRRLRIGILAGEASGDLLGARLLQALRERYDEVVVEGVGGPLMSAQGLASLHPMERLSVMGLVEPLKRLPELLRIRRAVYRHFRDSPPDLFLGIDSPDFNLGLEHRLRRTGVPTAHLVSPSVWAWRRGRIRNIRRAVDRMLCLFPFETSIYEEHGVPVSFVGHPLVDEISPVEEVRAVREALGLSTAGRVLALLPGSRGAEVGLLAPLFLQAAARLWREDPELSFIIPAASTARREELARMLETWPHLPVTLVSGRAREAIAAADAVLLASGTATLEAALLQRPMVVAYRMSHLSWWMMSRLVHTDHVALPNILSGRSLVPELLQGEVTAQALADALCPLLDDGSLVREQIEGMRTIRDELQGDFAIRSAEALEQMVESRREGPVHG
jgi:lipid-A-disaccharide synthase